MFTHTCMKGSYIATLRIFIELKPFLLRFFSMPYQTITLARSSYDHLPVRSVTKRELCHASRIRPAIPLENFGPQLRS